MNAADKKRHTNVGEQLQAARALLGEGRADEARQIMGGVLEQRALLSRRDLVHACGLAARLAALRGERVRASMLAELAVQLADSCETSSCQACAYLDLAHTSHALGNGSKALACLRRAHELAPQDVPAAASWEAFALVS
jgi:tetratricopeptide (TPR) repeat protein